MVAGGHRIITEDALKLVESLSLSTPTHGHTLVTYTSTDNRITSSVVDRNRYNHRTTESVGSMKEPTNFLISTACCCSASNLTFHAYNGHRVALAGVDQPQEITFPLPKGGMHGVESYWDPVARERSGFCS